MNYHSALRPPPRAALPLGAKAGDSASRYFLRPKLSRKLTITSQTPGGRPVPSGTQRLELAWQYPAGVGLFSSRNKPRPQVARASRPPSAGSATRTARGYTRRAAAPENYSAPTVIDRAPGEILPFQLFVETVYFPSKARRAGFLAAFCDTNPAKAPVGPPGTRKPVLARQLAITALRGRRPK